MPHFLASLHVIFHLHILKSLHLSSMISLSSFVLHVLSGDSLANLLIDHQKFEMLSTVIWLLSHPTQLFSCFKMLSICWWLPNLCLYLKLLPWNPYVWISITDTNYYWHKIYVCGPQYNSETSTFVRIAWSVCLKSNCWPSRIIISDSVLLTLGMRTFIDNRRSQNHSPNAICFQMCKTYLSKTCLWLFSLI